MGGGGSGALMSGRGAADALAKMTSVAGGFFLATSLGLTFLSGAASSNAGRSVFDLVPRQEQSVVPPAAAPATEAPAQPDADATRPDPTESSAPEAAQTQLASAPALTPAPNQAATRAAPLGPSSAAAATPAPAQRNTTAAPAQRAATQPASTNAPRTNAPATTAPVRSNPATTAQNERPLILPNTSGAVTGISLSDDPAAQPESIEIGNGLEAVRRDQRAGPEQ